MEKNHQQQHHTHKTTHNSNIKQWYMCYSCISRTKASRAKCFCIAILQWWVRRRRRRCCEACILHKHASVGPYSILSWDSSNVKGVSVYVRACVEWVCASANESVFGTFNTTNNTFKKKSVISRYRSILVCAGTRVLINGRKTKIVLHQARIIQFDCKLRLGHMSLKKIKTEITKWKLYRFEQKTFWLQIQLNCATTISFFHWKNLQSKFEKFN